MTTPKRKEPDDDSPSKRSVKKTKQTRCVTCSKDAGDKAILCQWCEKWEHRACAGISVDEYKILSTSSNTIMFFCSVCCPKVSMALKREDRFGITQNAINGLSTKIDECLLDQLKGVELRLQKSQDHLSQKLKDLESRLQAPKTSALEQQLKSLETISQQAGAVTADTASKLVDEYRDMKRRQWNLIIYNVPEEDSSDSVLRKAKDKEFFDSLIHSIGVGSVEVVDIVRLGARSPGKIRPLRVHFGNMEHRKTVLANARKLRDSTSSIYKKVYINPDLSKKQREAQWKLRQELARRKEGGETGIVIRRGHIVSQTRPNNHSSSVSMDDQNA